MNASAFSSLGRSLDADAAARRIPGAVSLVAVRGELLHWQAHGWTDEARQHRMPRDALFWIASMTKPIVCAAALTLVEEGKLALEDAVCEHLPQLRGMQVVDGTPVPDGQMKVLDLMRHTAGFTYAGLFDNGLSEAYAKASVYDYAQTNDDLLRKLARLPLMHAPGTTFEYGLSIDVLGCVIEACSGQPLDRFLRERLFHPLGMQDTGFVLPQAALARVAHPFPHDAVGLRPALQGVRWLSGGGGLWSTAPDYFRFAQMLLDGGVLDGKRILGEHSVAAMCSPQLPADVKYSPSTGALGVIAPGPGTGRVFGLGMSIQHRPVASQPLGGAGDFTWPGLSGANFWCDPSEQLVAVVLMQASTERNHYRRMSRQWVYEALRGTAKEDV